MESCWSINAAMESCWPIIKREVAWIRGSIVFDTRKQAQLYLFEFIEVFYNRQRHQAALGHRTRSNTPPRSQHHEHHKPVSTKPGQGQAYSCEGLLGMFARPLGFSWRRRSLIADAPRGSLEIHNGLLKARTSILEEWSV
jgi:hypothetical protein